MKEMEIKRGVLENCRTDEASITIPENVEKINNLAFGHCEKLKTVIIESKDTELEEHAFSNSKKVTIYAPKGSKAEGFAKEKGFKFKELLV